MLVKVRGIKIEAVYLLGRVLAGRRAYLPEQSVSETDLSRRQVIFTLEPLRQRIYYFHRYVI